MPLHVDKLVKLHPLAIFWLAPVTKKFTLCSSLQVNLRGSTKKQHYKHEYGNITDCFATISFQRYRLD